MSTLSELVRAQDGIDRCRQRLATLADERTALVRRLVDEGMPMADIARHLGITPQAVSKAAARRTEAA